MSNELVMDMSREIFKLDKDVLIFKINSSNFSKLSSHASLNSSDLKPLSEIGLNITNLTSDYIAFRSKTTKKVHYVVNPTYCIVPPNSVISLNLIFYNKPGQKLDPKGHKFKFEGFIIPESQKDIDVKELFKKYSSASVKVMGNIQKRNVQFSEENGEENSNLGGNNSLQSSGLSIYSVADNSKRSTFLMDKIQEKEEGLNNMRLSDIMVGKSEGNLGIENNKERLEILKKDYNQLKEQLDNLKRNENLLSNRIKNEKNKRNTSEGYSDKFKYKVFETKEKKFSRNTLIAIFACSILIGFYLTK